MQVNPSSTPVRPSVTQRLRRDYGLLPRASTLAGAETSEATTHVWPRTTHTSGGRVTLLPHPAGVSRTLACGPLDES